jgi:hypothetical protein
MSCSNLRSEYDLKSLKVRNFGSERKSFGKTTIHLEPGASQFCQKAQN